MDSLIRVGALDFGKYGEDTRLKQGPPTTEKDCAGIPNERSLVLGAIGSGDLQRIFSAQLLRMYGANPYPGCY